MRPVELDFFLDKFVADKRPIWKIFEAKTSKRHFHLNDSFGEDEMDDSAQALSDFLYNAWPGGNTVYIVTKTKKTANDDNMVAVKWGNGGSSIGSSRRSRGYENADTVQKNDVSMMGLMMQQNQAHAAQVSALQSELRNQSSLHHQQVADLRQQIANLKFENQRLREQNEALLNAPSDDPLTEIIAGQMPVIISGIFGNRQPGIAGVLGQRSEKTTTIEDADNKDVPESKSKFTAPDLPTSCDRFLRAAEKLRELFPGKHPNDIVELLVIYASKPANKVMADTVIGQLYNV